MNSTTQSEQISHHCEQAEWMLLASACEKPEIIAELKPELFYVNACQEIFAIMQKLKRDGKEPNWPRIGCAAFDKSPELFRMINDACDQLPSPAGWPYWLEICQEHLAARQLLAVAHQTENAAHVTSTGAATDLTVIQERLQEISLSRAPRIDASVGQVMPRVIERYDRAMTDPQSLYGLRTGFADLDALTFGMNPGNFWVIAGRPAQGKTALAVNIAASVAITQNKPTAFFSLEMSAEQITDRLLAIVSGVPGRTFLRGEASQIHLTLSTEAQTKIAAAKLYLHHDCSNLADIVARSQNHVQQDGVKLIIVDYLQRIHLERSRDSYFVQVGLISNALKNMAMALQVPVLALAQMSREVEKEKRMPRLSDLRDSGTIEQDADLVALLWEEHERNYMERHVPIKLLISKNRHGPNGTVELIFEPASSRFFDASAPSQPQP